MESLTNIGLIHLPHQAGENVPAGDSDAVAAEVLRTMTVHVVPNMCPGEDVQGHAYQTSLI
jgi:hypothetical protein